MHIHLQRLNFVMMFLGAKYLTKAHILASFIKWYFSIKFYKNTSMQNIKIVFVGALGVGKSSLLERYSRKRFDKNI